MSYIFSQALVAAFSPASCSDTDVSPPSSGSPTPKPCLWHDKTMEPSHLSRFGMTCKPLTDDPTEALQTWLQAVSPAKTSALLGGGAGLDGKRSGMWHHMARIIGEVRPRYAYIENSPALVNRGLDRVLSDLTALGFDAQWGVLGASDVGAHHKRERIWILARARSVANTYGQRPQQPPAARELPHSQERADKACCAQWREKCSAIEPDSEFQGMANPTSAGLPQWRCTGQPACSAQARSGLEPKLERCGDMAHTECNACCERFELSMQRGWQGEAQQTRVGGSAEDGPRQNAHDVANSNSNSLQGLEPQPQPSCDRRQAGLQRRVPRFPAWPADPADAPQSELGRVADGVANRANRIKAIGNGQVPRVAATAFLLLKDRL